MGALHRLPVSLRPAVVATKLPYMRWEPRCKKRGQSAEVCVCLQTCQTQPSNPTVFVLRVSAKADGKALFLVKGCSKLSMRVAFRSRWFCGIFIATLSLMNQHQNSKYGMLNLGILLQSSAIRNCHTASHPVFTTHSTDPIYASLLIF